MKHLLLTTIAAVLLVGCGKSQQSAPAPETPPAEPVAEVPAQPSSPQVEAELTEPVAEAAQPEPTTPKAPDISIHDAAKAGDIETVKQHLAAGTDVNAEDGGSTPLHWAADGGHKEIAKLLIVNGADVHAKNGDGRIPLHSAAKEGHKEIAELLITKGADVNFGLGLNMEEMGMTPLFERLEVVTRKLPNCLSPKVRMGLEQI